jgi:peptidoglycan/LPS O-acetylase OafA/YrhL
VSLTYRPALDGTRFLAVYLVLSFHAGLATAGGGFIGVDLFFVLSGFLVSSIILAEITEQGRLRLGRFYARRVRRLLPAAVVVILATSAVFLLMESKPQRLPLVRDAQSALLYVANFRFLFQSDDYFGADIDKSPFLHFWSLAVEEQFYLVFPLLLMGLAVLSRRRRWVLPAGLGALLAASLGAQLFWSRADVNHAYYGSDARLYQLVAGGLLAVALRSRTPSTRLGRVLAAGGLALLLVLASGLVGLTPAWRGIGATVAALALISGVMSDERGLVARVLATRVPTYLGRISYGTYLWHWPVILALLLVFRMHPIVIAALAAVTSTGIAALSYELLEMPIRRNHVLDGFRWPVVLTGLATTAVIAVAVVPAVLSSDRKPVLRTAPAASAVISAARAGWGDRPVPAGIDFKKVAQDRGPDDTFCTPKDLTSCVVHRGDGPTVVLVGDSHARMLAPMMKRLAREHDFTLALNVVIACPWQRGVVNAGQPRKHQVECATARDRWYDDVLPRLRPDIVMLAALPRDEGSWQGKFIAAHGPSGTPVATVVDRSTKDTLARVRRAGARSLLVQGLNGTNGLEPLDCLARARHLADCVVTPPAERPISDAIFRSQAVRKPDVYTVNLNPAMCPDSPLCLPVLGRTVVWRDTFHFTASIVVRQRALIWWRLQESHVFDSTG